MSGTSGCLGSVSDSKNHEKTRANEIQQEHKPSDCYSNAEPSPVQVALPAREPFAEPSLPLPTVKGQGMRIRRGRFPRILWPRRMNCSIATSGGFAEARFAVARLESSGGDGSRDHCLCHQGVPGNS